MKQRPAASTPGRTIHHEASVARAFLPNDPALPQLALALDRPAMSEVFADVVRPHGMQIDGCTIERVKYRPGRNATLGYRLHLRDPSGKPFDQHVAARLCGGQGAARASRASAAALAPSRAGPALRWLPALDMLTWWWPNDAKLQAPHRIADRRVLREQVLPALMTALGATGVTPRHGELAIVQYVPEHRLSARLDLDWQQGGRPHAKRVYAKASLEPDGATAHGLLTQLQASPAWQGGRLRTPRALLWHPETALHWQEGLPGQALFDADPTLAAACAAPLGAQLATLHATPVHVQRELTPDTLRARLREVSRTIAPLLGEQAVHLAAQALDAHQHLLDRAAICTLHGDFHSRNILVEERRDGPRLALIDLDGLRRGPAVLELGAWIAEAMYRGLFTGSPVFRDEASWCALIDAYVQSGGSRPEPRALRWATAWSLLTQRAWRCVVNLKPGHFALAPRVVALAAGLAGADSRNDLTGCTC